MAKLTNNTPITGAITPGNDDRNTWATHYAKFGAGGFEMVENESDVNDISLDRLKDKMVYVKADAKFMHHNGSTWVDSSIGGSSSVPQTVLDDIAKNKASIDRIKTDISTSVETVYTYRGSVAPTDILSAKHKAYYLTFFNLADNNFILDVPNPPAGLDDGTVFSVDNNDKSHYMNLQPASGHTINTHTGTYKINPDTFVFMVKQGNNWNVAFSGYLPRNLATVVTAIQSKLSNQLNTIDEIEAQLKDRLHTFREIQTEFKDQLHTLPAIESDMISKGFSKGFSIGYGYLDTATPPHDLDWVEQHIPPNQEVLVPAKNEGSKYLAIYMPVYLGVSIEEVLINTVVKETTSHDIVVNDADYKVLVINDPLDTSVTQKLKLQYHEQGSIPTGGIEIDDGTTNKAGIEKINFEGGYLSKVFDDSSEVTLKAVTSWDQQGGGGGRVNEVYVEEPLEVFLDPDTKPGENERVKLRIKHDYFELAKPPGYLAYLQENEEVLGHFKASDPTVRQAPVWFDDNVVGGDSPFIEVDKPNKGLGIQDYTDDDPNVTGGIPTLIAYRIAMKGKAPNDGFVEILLKKTNEGTPVQNGDYLVDVNNNPIGVRRNYKTGDDLGILDAMAIYPAKGITKFQCIVEHNFVDDGVMLEDRTQGASGIMIQALAKDYSTGDALLQFENDTNQNIEYTKHWNGDDIFNMDWALGYDRADVDINAGDGQTSVDGLHFYNNTNLKIGTASKTLTIHDNGTDMVYFSLGKIFTAEKTYMLRGKDLDIKITLQNQDAGYRVYMVKWTGGPDQYTNKIIDHYDPDQGAIPEANWALSGDFFIPENAVVGEHVMQGTLTVPADSTNFAVVLVPATKEMPMSLSVKGFEINVSEGFYGWVLEAPELAHEQHLQFAENHATFSVKNNGYRAFRYTINNVPSGLPMPVGTITKGKADITLDQSINQVVGSLDHAYEGALKFNAEGKAIIDTEVYIHSEKAHSTVAQTSFWWSKVSQDGSTFTKIPLSEYTVGVRGQTKAINKMPRFQLDVQAGDRIALFATTDQSDGCFIEADLGDPIPMVKVQISFDEVTEAESDLLDKLTELDEELVITERAKAGGWYIELDVNPDTGVPSLAPKQRNP